MQAEKKPVYTAVATAALVLIVAFAIFGRWGKGERPAPGTDGTATTTTSTTSTVSGTLRMEVVTVASTTGLYRIAAEYPTFPGAPALTKSIQDYVDASVREFEENARENDAARTETMPQGQAATPVEYSLYLSWESAQLNTRFVSLVMHLYAFDGGANGRQELRSFNWDVQQQREVPLSALFLGMPDYLQRVSTYTRQVLAGQLGEATDPEFLNDGTKPDPASFQWFTFTDQAVNIYFPKYQVAPGAAGEQMVTIPREAQGLF